MSRKLQFMLCELESHQLTVILAPSKRHDRRDWDMIRVCVDKSPRWYAHFCSAHESGRKNKRAKHDTLIKRRETLKALNRLIEGRALGTVYEERILAIAKGIKI